MDKCDSCITPIGTRCESSPSGCPYNEQTGFTHVAIKINDLIFKLKKPNRHYHLIKKMDDIGIQEYDYKSIQGFIYNNEFVNRKLGAKYAEQIGIVLKTPPLLFSEDLW